MAGIFFFNFLNITVIIILLSGVITMSQSLSGLKEKIKERLDRVEGDYAAALKIFDEKPVSIFINEKEIFHAASTMKTPIMIEVFKQAAEGRFSLDDSVVVKNEFKSIVDSSAYSMDLNEDSGEELYRFIGKKKTIRELVHDMIKVSSNLATNILIDIVSAKSVMKTMKEIGADDIQVLRGVEDIKAFRQGLNNTTTAYDLMLVYENLAKKKFISEEASDEMIEILSEQKHKDRIPAKLPSNIKVAHKTGWITGVGHDSGIIFLPDGRKYVLVLLSKNVKDDEAMKSAQADVSKIIFDYLTE